MATPFITTKQIEQISPIKYKYYLDEFTSYIIYLPSNRQAISINIIENSLNLTTCYKIIFTPDSLSEITRLFKSYISVDDIKSDLMTIFGLGLFEFGEKTSTTLQLYLSFDNKIRDVILYKVHEEVKCEIDKILKEIKNEISTSIIPKQNSFTNNYASLEDRIAEIEKNTEYIIAKMNEKKEKPKQPEISLNIQPNPLNESSVYDNEYEMITRWIGKRCQIKFNLIYRGSSCNFNSEEFHIKFDDAVPTLVVIQSRSGARFGGYTTQIWKGENTYKNDPEAFLFSLDKKEMYPILKTEAKNAIFCKGEYIVAFGKSDLMIPGKGLECFSDFPISYGKPGVEKNALTNGEKKFGLKEIEIFQLVFVC